MAIPVPHANDDLDELIIDIGVLIAEELDLTHLLGGHHRRVEGCARCERRRPVPGPPWEVYETRTHSAGADVG